MCTRYCSSCLSSACCKNPRLTLMSHLFWHRNELILVSCFQLVPYSPLHHASSSSAVAKSAGIAPGYLVAWASVLGTVSCHRRFGNSIGGKAHRRTPRRSQMEGPLPVIRAPRPMCPWAKSKQICRCPCKADACVVLIQHWLVCIPVPCCSSRLLGLATTFLSKMRGITELF